MKGSTAVIRDRYQLTIPEEIRRYLSWLSPRQAVNFVMAGKEKLIIEPYQARTMSWSEIWRKLAKIEKWGRQTSLSDFVITDRESH